MLVMGMPPWFPLGAEVVTDYQIPVLPLVPVDDLPTEMLAYDKIGKAIERRLVLGNFYVDETKLRRLIRNPERFISQFEGLWGMRRRCNSVSRRRGSTGRSADCSPTMGFVWCRT